MALTSIPVKTAEGLSEIGEQRLSPHQRTMLLLVDGKRSMVEVQTMALHEGAPPSCMDDLMAFGLIVITQPTVPITRFNAADPDAAEPLDIWLGSGWVPAALETEPAALGPATGASERPLRRNIDPGSLNGDPFAEIPLPSPSRTPDKGEAIAALNEARGLLLRAVRLEAPLAGSLTMLRLLRARTGEQLHALLDEVEMRISKPQRAQAAEQTLNRVRQLLNGAAASDPPKF